jgi:hypothetical protein
MKPEDTADFIKISVEKAQDLLRMHERYLKRLEGNKLDVMK